MNSQPEKKKRLRTHIKQPDPPVVQEVTGKKGLSKYRLGMISLAFIVIMFVIFVTIIFGRSV